MDILISNIVKFFNDKKNNLKDHLNKTENNLLNEIQFESELNLEKDSLNGAALFGYGSLKPDYHPKKDKNIIIEVKYIRIKTTENGNHYNECDIKNALSQIIEQAVCKKARNAILLILDAGRAREREWNAMEGKFISMFQQNPFNINLKVVRIRILEDGKKIDIKTEII